MKVTYLTSLAALALAAAMTMPASASPSTGNVVQDVQSAIGSSGQVSVSVRNGVATLTGYTDNQSIARRAQAAAANHDNVDTVINLITAN